MQIQPLYDCKPNLSHGYHQPEFGSITQVIIGDSGVIQPFQLLPVLAQCNQDKRWLMWFSPNQMMSKASLLGSGLEQAPILNIATYQNTQKELCLRAIKAAKSHIIIEWIGHLSRETKQQLKIMAEGNGTHLMILRVDE